MARVSISEAARLTGKSRTTLHRLIKAGDLSTCSGERNAKMVDTSELLRVFGPFEQPKGEHHSGQVSEQRDTASADQSGFAPIFPDICYHLTHYKPAAADIPVASDNPAHYADAIRYNARTPLQGSLLPLTRLVWA